MKWGVCVVGKGVGGEALRAQMRTVNISYLYLEGDTEGSENSNRVRCMTHTHTTLTVAVMLRAAGGS